MNTLEVTVLIGVGAFLAGLLGALTGLGGGVVIVPLLAGPPLKTSLAIWSGLANWPISPMVSMLK